VESRGRETSIAYSVPSSSAGWSFALVRVRWSIGSGNAGLLMLGRRFADSSGSWGKAAMNLAL